MGQVRLPVCVFKMMNKIYPPFIFIFLLLLTPIVALSFNSDSLNLELKYPIIPVPKKTIYGADEIHFSTVFIESKEFEQSRQLLTSFFNGNGIKSDKNGFVVELIKIDEQELNHQEAYRLIAKDRIQIFASDERGAFYGVQTLKQLLLFNSQKARMPEIEVEDWPVFQIRGFMHDTGRNFQSVALLKEQIDILALYKYNVFHWHLTDNPGWRLESKKYPQLQDTAVTSRKKGRFYSQDDFKEILAYCKERYITVIPELDIPGHTEAFRKAFGIEKMSHEKVAPILYDLFNELCDLADPAEMPYVHIGTDEVKRKIETVDHEVIENIMTLLKKRDREVIVWRQGITVPGDSISINQLWAQYKRRKGRRYIDSRSNYINHLDPFAGMSRLFFQQPTGQSIGDSVALGGILCAWPDNIIDDERDILVQNPIYPSMVFYADAIWNGRAKDQRAYWAKLPEPGNEALEEFKNFELKVVRHRDRFFKNKPFPYLAQSEVQWKLLGPLDHHGDMDRSFEMEKRINSKYEIDGKEVKWEGPYTGATIHLKHFFGFPSYTEEKEGTYYAYSRIYSPDDRTQDFWLGFQGWSRSGRRGGPTPLQGQWHRTNPKIWVNGSEIAPPVWKQPGLGSKTSEIPYVDEDYFYREPTPIKLKKGWNKILLKIPHGGDSWKWMFTCIPVSKNGMSVQEVTELEFDTKFNSPE